MSNGDLPVIFLMGATATGKTDVAIRVFNELPVEIISVDSAMVYRGMDIGTAKPSSDLLNQVPHRLIDIRDPTDSYSAAQFRQDALNAIKEIIQNGNIPLLVGGTGLYFRTLQYGLSELPEGDAGVRAQLEQEAREKGLEYLHQRLQKVDPDAAQRIHPNDPQRLQRALEVYQITGLSLTEHFRENRGDLLDHKIIKIILTPQDREQHRQIIGQRFHDMLAHGLVEEVSLLQQRPDLHAGLPSIRMVGYRQIWRYLEGQLSYDEMLNHAIIATQQLAKRQFTWLRKEQDFHEFTSDDVDKSAKVLKFLQDCADLTAL